MDHAAWLARWFSAQLTVNVNTKALQLMRMAVEFDGCRIRKAAVEVKLSGLQISKIASTLCQR